MENINLHKVDPSKVLEMIKKGKGRFELNGTAKKSRTEIINGKPIRIIDDLRFHSVSFVPVEEGEKEEFPYAPSQET